MARRWEPCRVVHPNDDHPRLIEHQPAPFRTGAVGSNQAKEKERTKHKMKFISTVISFAIHLMFHVLISGLLIMLAWNFIMPDLFQLPRLDFIHACGLAFLVGQLFPYSEAHQRFRKDTLPKNLQPLADRAEAEYSK